MITEKQFLSGKPMVVANSPINGNLRELKYYNPHVGSAGGGYITSHLVSVGKGVAVYPPQYECNVEFVDGVCMAFGVALGTFFTVEVDFDNLEMYEGEPLKELEK